MTWDGPSDSQPGATRSGIIVAATWHDRGPPLISQREERGRGHIAYHNYRHHTVITDPRPSAPRGQQSLRIYYSNPIQPTSAKTPTEDDPTLLKDTHSRGEHSEHEQGGTHVTGESQCTANRRGIQNHHIVSTFRPLL